jgi:hypothetical protein
MRARGLDRRPWCLRPSVADRRAAAAARRELAGRLLGAALPCRNDGRVGQDHHGCCLLELGLGHHEHLHRGVPGPAQLARRARARRQGRLCRLAWTPTTPCCSRTCGVRGLRSWPALFGTWRTASSRSFSRCADRRRWLRAAGLSATRPSSTAAAAQLVCRVWGRASSPDGQALYGQVGTTHDRPQIRTKHARTSPESTSGSRLPRRGAQGGVGLPTTGSSSRRSGGGPKKTEIVF